MYPHPMRLRGPWEVEPVARLVRRDDGRVEILAGPVPPPFRMVLSGHETKACLTDFAGRKGFKRRFGYPGRIDAHERVWLTFDGIEGATEVWLNGVLLGKPGETANAYEFEVTGLLQGRNELVVQVDAPEGHGGRWGEVAMEVRCAAFLRNVQIAVGRTEEAVSLRVTGEIAGTAAGPLELYVLLDGATVYYSPAEPVDPWPFQATIADLSKE